MSKQTKLATRYRVTPFATKDCGNCQSMNNDGSCDKVEGKVDKQHICDLWTAKTLHSHE